jgi:mannose-1-phosphate guanylyltransferase
VIFMNEHYYAVIMAGGGGTRLWPLSRQGHPKQLLALVDQRSMFQMAVDRILEVFPPQRIFVVTIQEQAQDLQAQCPTIPSENYLIEPAPRGTASAVGLAAVVLQHLDPQAVMAVLASDHYIQDEPRFRQLLLAAEAAAEQDYLVTLGIEPTFPSTGFGYIERGEAVGQYATQQVYQVERFKEKPSQSQAETMLKNGQHDWNSGMFFWKAKCILDEIQRQMPVLYAGLEDIHRSWGGPGINEIVSRIWSGLRTETIDYGVMENARNVVVLPAGGLGWSDIGSWDSLFDLLPGDVQGNIVLEGQYYGLATKNSLISNQKPGKLVVTIGVDNLVIVDTDDVLLVCRRDQAQQVRQVVRHLKETGNNYT